MSGRTPIRDEFSALSVSRQRKWQLRRRKEGRCAICGREAGGHRYCDIHCLAQALTGLKKRGTPRIARRGKWLTLAGERG